MNSNLDGLPSEVQDFIAKSGLAGRVVGVAPLIASESDAEAIEAWLKPERQNLLLSHYTTWPRLKWLIENRLIWMRRIDKFSDAADGTYPAANKTQNSLLDQGLQLHLSTIQNSEETLKSHKIARTRTFAHSWFEGWEEDARMWWQYADMGKGVCICSRSSKIKLATAQMDDTVVALRGCIYRDDNESPIPEAFGDLPLVCKRREFQGENEYRLIVAEPNREISTEVSECYHLPVRPNILIERIIVGPMILSEELEEVKALRCQFPDVVVLPPKITQSEIHKIARTATFV